MYSILTALTRTRKNHDHDEHSIYHYIIITSVTIAATLVNMITFYLASEFNGNGGYDINGI